jgi:uncharacterized protein
MIIRVSNIQEDGLTVDDGAASGSTFADPAWRLDGLNLKFERDDHDVLVSGEIQATVPQVCGRCLEPFPARVRARVDVRVVPRPATGDSVELASDDLDVDFYKNDELDVGALIETETTLVLPMKPLCRDDCQGLCPVCGGNRNVTVCACAQRAPDPRLGVLRDRAERLSH